MPSNKKYKLLSAAGDGSKRPCAFFASPEGCRQGDSCKFSHDVVAGKANVVAERKVSVEVGSVVSSESEPEDSGKSSSKDVHPSATLDASDATSDKKKKKNRRGKRPEDFTPFANPKKKVKIETAEVASPPETKMSQTKVAKTKDAHPAKSNNPPQRAVPNFRKLNLPIAAFPVAEAKDVPPAKQVKMEEESDEEEEQADSKTPQTKSKVSNSKSAPPAKVKTPPKRATASLSKLNLPVASYSVLADVKIEDSDEEDSSGKESNSIDQKQLILDSLPLPRSTPVGRKWMKALQDTRQHDDYLTLFDFDKYKKIDEELGISARSAWVKAKPYGAWCSEAPQSIAIDCEMCETQDPVSGKKNHKALCRISIVDGESKEVLLDTLVKPAWPVTNHRTWVNGIKPEHLENVQFTIRHAQAFMVALCSEETIIIGHSVNNDLAAIQMEHHCVVDSALLFKSTSSTTRTVALRDLSTSILGKSMPDTHDSVNDARTALECLEHYVQKDGKVALIECTSRPTPKGAKNFHYFASRLFVHRIPKLVTEEHLSKLFLSHADIQPQEVEPIEFNGNNGKTHVVFLSPEHANLAFNCIEGGKVETDPTGRLQKKVYLIDKNYIKIRKMAFEKDRKDTDNEKAVHKAICD